MGLTERIHSDLTAAMKARDAFRTSCLRMVKSALKNREIDKRAPLDDKDAVEVLKSLAKQRADSIEQFEAGGRLDLAQKEREEKALIEGYLPAAIGRDDIELTVGDVIRDLKAAGAKEIGRVMKESMARLQATGKLVDGKVVNEIVRARLGG